MKSLSRIVHRAGIVVALIAGLAVSACANKPATDSHARPALPRRAASRTSWSMSATACSSNPTRPS